MRKARDASRLAELLWNYHKLNHNLNKADIIFTLGSNDIRVAERAVQLWKDNLAPLIVFSGKRGRLTKGWVQTEADVFAGRAKDMGVPEDSMILEKESANTGENVLFTKKILEEKKVRVSSIICVQKPYMERRSFATLKALWPQIEVKAASPKIEFENYANQIITREQIINYLVGSTQRMKVYAERGWQIPQNIPTDVWEAHELLIEAGYDKELV